MAASKTKKEKAPQKQPVGLVVQLSKDNNSLLITADLTKQNGQNKKGANIYALTPNPVRLSHPTIPGLTYMIKVLQRVSNDPPELALMKQQQAELKGKIKAFREQRRKK